MSDGTGPTRRDVLRAAGGAVVAGSGLLAGASQVGAQSQAAWHSQLVYPGPDGRLVYRSDANGNRIPDFSWAGYRNGEAPLPVVPVKRTIGPISGDNTAHIQQALDEVGALPLDANGFRGAVLLRPGTYTTNGTIRLNRSGVVLRGSGPDKEPATNTIIYSTVRSSGTTVCDEQPTGGVNAITVGGAIANWDAQVPGTITDVVTDRVRVGSRTFTVADASNLKVGDNIIVFHPHTVDWGKAINNGGVVNEPPWPVGSRPIVYNRYIRAIDGNDITICAPVYNHLDRSLSKSYVYVWDDGGRLVRNVGVENLRIDIKALSAEDERQARNGIRLQGVEDAWVLKCHILHFWFAGVDTHAVTRSTIKDTWAYSPRSMLCGSRRYNFNAGINVNQVLFRDIISTYARHAFAASGTTRTSGCAWVNGYNQYGYSASGGHHRWSQGLLYDNIEERDSKYSRGWVISLQNHGDEGGGHGWSSVHSVAWNCKVGPGKWVCVKRPPTAQNYAIGTTGNASGSSIYPGPTGYIEGTNRAGLDPASLYDAQLRDRLTPPAG